MFEVKNKEQILGDKIYVKMEKLFPNKIKKCQRITGMFLDYNDRDIIEKSLTNNKLFNELVEGAIISIQKLKK